MKRIAGSIVAAWAVVFGFLTLGWAEDPAPMPEFLAKVDRALFRGQAAGVKTVTAVMLWKSAFGYPREGKDPIEMKGLQFDLTMNFDEGDDLHPSCSSKLKNPPAGLSAEDKDNLENFAATTIWSAFDSPLEILKEFLQTKDAKLTVGADGRSAEAKRKAGDGIIYTGLQYALAEDRTSLQQVEIGDQGIFDRTVKYKLLWQGERCLITGMSTPEIEHAYRGIEREVVWQDVGGVPVIRSFREVSSDATAPTPKETTEMELSDAKVEKK